jgi:hypothetical protein
VCDVPHISAKPNIRSLMKMLRSVIFRTKARNSVGTLTPFVFGGNEFNAHLTSPSFLCVCVCVCTLSEVETIDIFNLIFSWRYFFRGMPSNMGAIFWIHTSLFRPLFLSSQRNWTNYVRNYQTYVAVKKGRAMSSSRIAAAGHLHWSSG